MSIREVDDVTFKPSIPAAGWALVDFGAPWCAPCKRLLPILDELDQEYGDSLTILKINVDECPESVAAFGVMSMPTVIVFRDGQPVQKFVGLRSKETYRMALEG